MFKSKKWTLILLALVLIIVASVFLIGNKNFTDKEEVSLSKLEEIKIDSINTSKMDQFIQSKLPYHSDVFIHFSERGDKVLLDDKKRETLDLFFKAIKDQDLDSLTMSIAGDSIQELWGAEIDIESRLEILSNTLLRLSRNNTLETMYYEIEKDKYDMELNQGKLYFVYSNGHEIPIEFELELIGNHMEEYYQIVTPIKEILNIVES